jgi:hypothetical protein
MFSPPAYAANGFPSTRFRRVTRPANASLALATPRFGNDHRSVIHNTELLFSNLNTIGHGLQQLPMHMARWMECTAASARCWASSRLQVSKQ